MPKFDAGEVARIHQHLHSHLPSESALRVKALETLLVEKGLVNPQTIDAWVEAYIRPEDCSDALINSGQAGRLGAWLRLDATPPSGLEMGLSGTDEALDFAKSLWRDYVLGLQADTQSRVMSSRRRTHS